MVLYQADVRARMEHLERLRRQGTRDPAFKVAQPWDWSLRQVTLDGAFWKKEMEEPAILILSGSGRLMEMVDGDAPIASAATPAAAAPARVAHPPARLAAKSKDSRARQHHVQNGAYTANRSGAELCHGYQNGSCMGAVKGNHCARNSQYVHQCAKCLSNDHGADKCAKSSAPSSSSGGKGKGSKGRGKGGGKPHF